MGRLTFMAEIVKASLGREAGAYLAHGTRPCPSAVSQSASCRASVPPNAMPSSTLKSMPPPVRFALPRYA